jgi:hypothetical protein
MTVKFNTFEFLGFSKECWKLFILWSMLNFSIWIVRIFINGSVKFENKTWTKKKSLRWMITLCLSLRDIYSGAVTSFIQSVLSKYSWTKLDFFFFWEKPSYVNLFTKIAWRFSQLVKRWTINRKVLGSILASTTRGAAPERLRVLILHMR